MSDEILGEKAGDQVVVALVEHLFNETGRDFLLSVDPIMVSFCAGNAVHL
jgi:hypothetical protein